VSKLIHRHGFRKGGHPIKNIWISSLLVIDIQSSVLRREQTLMIGSWPLTPSTSFFFLMSTFKSLPFRLPGTSTVISRSPIVWVHLYGRAACSSASFARAAASSAGVSSGNFCQLKASQIPTEESF